ncbi:phosphotransferase family protein [Antribacter gilvus]|uniref:phosphotransferase family protein n=1 Tax=Antribacter gilvus TaxID=2304675 RepID=UPI000F79FD87|nr:aminoglycoside phosphotransferase family protein [Antribacter gilvus]
MDRRSWEDLPGPLRDAVEVRTGTVIRTETPIAGRNSAFAAFLHTADRVVFCKGVPEGERLSAAHRHEVRVNRALPDEVDAPWLLWDIEEEGWLLAGYECVPGEHADLSPGSPHVEPVIDAVSRLGAALTPSPLPDVASLGTKYDRLAGWQWIADRHGAELTSWEKDHLEQLVDADLRVGAALAGDTLVHGDIHGLNILVDAEAGRARIIDWAWSRIAAPWVDVALLVVRLVADGHTPAEAERLTARAWGMQRAEPDDLTVFAAAVYGQWRRFGIEFPSPHRRGATDGAAAWARHRIEMAKPR